MERTQSGDKEAFQVLFSDIGPLVNRFVRRRRVLDQADVDDICQEVLLAVFRSRHTYQPARPFEPWLFAIIRNVLSGYLQRNRQRIAWHEPMGELPDIFVEDTSSLAIELHDGLRQLSANQLEALKLTNLDGFSVAESAMRARTSTGAMKVRIHRAYESLKKSILR